MHSHSLDQWTHDHVFLGPRHAHNERRTWFVVALTAIMMVGEIVAGTLFGSMALLADGWRPRHGPASVAGRSRPPRGGDLADLGRSAAAFALQAPPRRPASLNHLTVEVETCPHEKAEAP